MMIRVDKNAVPYLSGLTVCGAVASFSALKGVNEFCGFYQDELTEKNKKDHISYARLIHGFAWLAFSAFSGLGCYLLMNKFTDTKTSSINENLTSSHRSHLNDFSTYYLDRYKEKNSLRNLCWNYVQSDEGLKALKGGHNSNSIQSITAHAYQAFHTVEREAESLKNQLQSLKEGFDEDSRSLREHLQNYEVARGLHLDFNQICQTPYGWLNTKHCEAQKNLDNQLKQYSLLEEEIEEYKNEAFSMGNIAHCQESYGINTRFDTVYDLGKIRTAEENESWWQWIMSFFNEKVS